MFGRNVAILTRTTCTFRVTEKKVAIAKKLPFVQLSEGKLSSHSIISLLQSFGFDKLKGHAIAFPNSKEAFPILFTLAQGWW